MSEPVRKPNYRETVLVFEQWERSGTTMRLTRRWYERNGAVMELPTWPFNDTPFVVFQADELPATEQIRDE